MVPRAGFGPDSQVALESELRKRLGRDVSIVYQQVDSIPRLPNGKFRAVISELERGPRRT
jgi:hypothetical protein